VLVHNVDDFDFQNGFEIYGRGQNIIMTFQIVVGSIFGNPSLYIAKWFLRDPITLEMKQIYAGLPLWEQKQALYIILVYFISQDCHIVHVFPLKTACHVQKKADQSMISPHDVTKVFIFILKRMCLFPMWVGPSGHEWVCCFRFPTCSIKIHLGEIIVP